MNILPSECSGDCESGWTLYLEQSYLSPNPTHRKNDFNTDAKTDAFCNNGKNSTKQAAESEAEEEEDLSMLSDASSGPPHFHEEESYFNYDNNGCSFYKDTTLLMVNNGSTGNSRQKKKEHRRHKQDQEQPSFLDDTASSPAFNFSKHNNFARTNNIQASMESVLDYSQGFSATHFHEGRSAYQDHINGYIHPSLSGNQFQNNQWF